MNAVMARARDSQRRELQGCLTGTARRSKAATLPSIAQRLWSFCTVRAARHTTTSGRASGCEKIGGIVGKMGEADPNRGCPESSLPPLPLLDRCLLR